MIEVDISNVWGEVALQDLLQMEKEVFDAHQMLTDGTGAGSDFIGWLDLPVSRPTGEMRRITAVAEQIRQNSDIFVVVGIGGSSLGPRAAIELLQGRNRNMGRGKGDPQIFFAGNTLSTRAWNELLRLLEGKDFSIAVISKSGTTTEPAITTRALRRLLERKYGISAARERIIAITDPENGVLRQMATEESWESFVIPPDVGDHFSVLTAAGLLPMAVAGIDINAVMAAAFEAKKLYNIRSFENPVWLYAAVRNLLYRQGKAIELLASFEPEFKMTGAWWQLLFGESEGKDGKGIFPATAEFTADLHSLGQLIQQGQRNLFETMIRFDPAADFVMIGGDIKNSDGLNYLTGCALDYVEEQAYLGIVDAHTAGYVPVITIHMGELNDAKLGELFYFFQLACGISAYLLGVNPFDQPGVELYKRNTFHLLGKPGYETL